MEGEVSFHSAILSSEYCSVSEEDNHFRVKGHLNVAKLGLEDYSFITQAACCVC